MSDTWIVVIPVSLPPVLLSQRSRRSCRVHRYSGRKVFFHLSPVSGLERTDRLAGLSSPPTADWMHFFWLLFSLAARLGSPASIRERSFAVVFLTPSSSRTHVMYAGPTVEAALWMSQDSPAYRIEDIRADLKTWSFTCTARRLSSRQTPQT